MKKQFIRRFVVGIAIVVAMALFTACAGVGANGGNGGATTLSGSVVAVDVQHHSVTLNVNGQTRTINGLTDQEISALQGQAGKFFSLQVTQNSDGSYTIEANTNVTPEPNETPNTNTTGVSGSIKFIGKVQSVNASSIVVSLPNGQNLSANIVAGQTDESDFNGAQPSAGQLIKVTATANADGSYTATALKQTDSSDLQDQNVVTYVGVTSSAVGSDRVIHFQVGNKSYSFAIPANADLGDFNGNAQSIGNNVSVKVDVLYNGANGSVTKVSNANN